VRKEYLVKWICEDLKATKDSPQDAASSLHRSHSIETTDKLRSVPSAAKFIVFKNDEVLSYAIHNKNGKYLTMATQI